MKTWLKRYCTIASLLVVSAGCSEPGQFTETAKATNGIVNLTQEKSDSGLVRLSGDWKFYKNAVYKDGILKRTDQSDIVMLPVPGTWPVDLFKNDPQSPGTSGHYGVYEVNIRSELSGVLGIRFTEVISESCLYMNDRLLHCEGRPDVQKESAVANTSPFTVYFNGGDKPEFTLYLQVSNHNHRKGGVFGPVYLGTAAKIQELNDKKTAGTLYMAGGLFLLAVYFGFLSFKDQKNRVNLSLFWFLIVILARILSSGEKTITLLIPDIPYSVYLRIQYISLFLAIPAVLTFLKSIFPAEVHKRVIQFSYFAAGIFSAVVLLLPASLYSYTSDIFLVLFITGLIYAVYCLVMAVMRKRNQSRILAAGFTAFPVAVFFEILRVYYQYYNYLFKFEEAIVLFTLSLAVATSMNSSQAQKKIFQIEKERDIAKQRERDSISFLSRMSHELRTPLHSIIHISHILKSDPAPTEKRHFIDTLEYASEHLLSLVNNTLDFNQLQLSTITLEKSEFLLKRLAEHVIDIHRERAASRNIELKLRIDQSLNNQLYLSDQGKISQILHNLIGNSIKFTSQGHIILRISESQNHVQFSVLDTGIGISETEMENIFKPYHTEFQIKRLHEGSGLGLAISKQMIELLGGSLKISSRPQKGSLFRFALPLEKAGTVTGSVPQADAISRKVSGTVLIIDDNSDNLRLNEFALKRSNLKTESCTGGKEAAEKINSGLNPDIILLDIHMPGLDGFETAKRIRQAGFKKTIIASTADVSEETRNRIFESGFDDILLKPFNGKQLIGKISEHLKPY